MGSVLWMPLLNLRHEIFQALKGGFQSICSNENAMFCNKPNNLETFKLWGFFSIFHMNNVKLINRGQWLPALRDQPPTSPHAAGLNTVHYSVENPHSKTGVTCTNGRREQWPSAVPQARNLPEMDQRMVPEMDLLTAALLRTARAGPRICVLPAYPHSLPSLLHSPKTSCRGRTLGSESPIIKTPTWKPWSMRQASLILHSSPPERLCLSPHEGKRTSSHLLGPSRGQIMLRLRQLTH